MPRISIWFIKTKIVAKTRKWAKGTSVRSPTFPPRLLFSLEYKRRQMLQKAPTQKARTTAPTPNVNHRSAPMPKTSLASTKPIHLPSERNHNSAKGMNKANGAKRSKKSIVVKGEGIAYLQYT